MSYETSRNPGITLRNRYLSPADAKLLLWQASNLILASDEVMGSDYLPYAAECIGRLFDQVDSRIAAGDTPIKMSELIYVAGTEMRAQYGDRVLRGTMSTGNPELYDDCAEIAEYAGDGIDTVRQYVELAMSSTNFEN